MFVSSDSPKVLHPFRWLCMACVGVGLAILMEIQQFWMNIAMKLLVDLTPFFW
jgi:hypothetical protein